LRRACWQNSRDRRGSLLDRRCVIEHRRDDRQFRTAYLSGERRTLFVAEPNQASTGASICRRSDVVASLQNSVRSEKL
jgi:hypothetical protein